MRAPIGATADRADWRDVVAHRDDTFIEDFDVFDEIPGRLGAQRRPGQDLHRTLAAQPSVPGVAAAPSAAPFFIASDEAAYAMSLSVNPN